jgi:hypothetical protein
VSQGEAVDKADWAAMMLVMCHIKTMTGQPPIIDSGRVVQVGTTVLLSTWQFWLGRNVVIADIESGIIDV